MRYTITLYHVVLLETAVIQIEEDKKIIKWKKMKYSSYLLDEGALHPMMMMMNETVEKGKNKMMLHVNLLHVVLLRENMYCRRNSRSRGGRTTEITITAGQPRRDSNERNRQPRVHSMQIDDPAFAHRLLEYVMNNFGARGTATAAGRQ